MKSRKPIIVSIVLAVLAAVMLFAVSCGDDNQPKTYTMTFVTDGGTEIEPIKTIGGSMIFVPSDPTKSGSTFAGWYTDSKFSGEPVDIPNVMPNKNVTYYAKFDPIKNGYTLTYDFNIGKAPHAADIDNVTVEAGSTVTVADGNDYGAVGYMFMGWSIYPNGLVADVKQDGQYNAGDKITLDSSNIKLYAQWAVEYTDSRNENEDKVYVYEPLVGKGKGAAKLIRADKEKQNLDGFVMSDADTTSGYKEFTFYADEFDGGEFMGRLNANRTYTTSDGKQGEYVMYDYVYGENVFNYVLALDGFGYAVITKSNGDQISIFAYGDYEYDSEQGDFEFKYNTETDNNAKQQTSYFNVVRQKVVDDKGNETDYDGLFTLIGGESGTFANIYIYDNTYYADYYMQLSGYGNATFIDVSAEDEVSITGVYYGTDNYTSVAGEWEFVPDDAEYAEYKCKFTLDVMPIYDAYGNVQSYFNVFYICDETIVGTYTAEDTSDKSTLYLDGYGWAEYSSNGVVYLGAVNVQDGGIVEFTVYAQNATSGQMEPTTNVMVFVITDDNKFAVSKDGLIIVDNVLTDYKGKSTAVEIPDGVTEIADNAFNYVNTGVSLISVTVAASVDTIGAHAFQNNYTLRRIVFLSETPIELNFDNDHDPFRWGRGDFTIVVPDEAVDAYKAAWDVYADKIIGITEANTLPKFVIEDGVLVRYNKPDDIGEDELIDEVIPDEVTEIADYVFRGVTGIRSIDLNNVTKVGDYAFYGCADLETVKFTNVQSLGVMAFAACDKLNNSDADVEDVLVLPAIKTIGESAFSACESLRLVQLGASIAEIGDFAFYECNIYLDDPALVVELLGDGKKVPEMGNKVTLGNIAFRFKVQSIEHALNCYNADSWSDYCRHLYLESGDEKGTYISGEDTLVLDGRAIYQSSYVWMYSIDGEKITFYEYDPYSDSANKYATIVGTYKDGVIKVAIGNSVRYFTRLTDSMTYTTKDGLYTLVCDPMDLQPESYENNKGTATVMFNGKEVELHIVGYGAKMIYGFEEGGKKYDVSITFNGDTMEVSKKLSDVRYSDITAPDGSKITILFRNGFIYIEKAEFEIVVDEQSGRKLYWTEASGLGVFAEQNGNVFTFSFRYLNKTYSFTVTVSEDYKTFTYNKTEA